VLRGVERSSDPRVLVGHETHDDAAVLQFQLGNVSAAIANAVRDATGHRFTELPITSEAVRRALGDDAHP